MANPMIESVPRHSADPGAPDPGSEGVSLTDQAYRELEERIVTLVLAPGAVLSETRLSESLGIGRTPVREALQRLAREGLVVVLPRRGVLVSDFNVKSHLRMLEVRREVERLMARCAARRSNAQERDAFRKLASDMREAAAAREDIRFMRLDRAFNQLVASAARNEFAVKTVDLMAGLSRRFFFMHKGQAEDLTVTAEAHARLAEAIAEGDTARAGAESDRLMDHIEAITRSAVDW